MFADLAVTDGELLANLQVFGVHHWLVVQDATIGLDESATRSSERRWSIAYGARGGSEGQ